MINRWKRVWSAVFLVIIAGCTYSLSQGYESRCKLWFPQISKSLMVTISNGDEMPRGLCSGLFFSIESHVLLEPNIQRANGTFVTSHAIISQADMKVILNKIDSLGTKSNFTTCSDSNRISQNLKIPFVEVVWQSNSKQRLYDRYALSASQMKSFLNELLETLKTKKGRQVTMGLFQGCISLQTIEIMDKSNKTPQPATRRKDD